MRGIATLVLVFVLASCAAPAAEVEEVPMTLAITSTAFSQGQPIPGDYSCDGKGQSPPVAWSGAPGGTKSFALIMDDPDAPMGTFVHWVIYDIAASSSGLPEAMPKEAKLADGSLQGPGTMGRAGYSPPCPPGGTHRYFFKLYALDIAIDAAGLGKDQLLTAMEGHILAQGELMGTYTRK
jgi:hypothetical protein